jgi:hypothetical protein
MRQRLACFALSVLSVFAASNANAQSTAADLAKLAPDANPKVLSLALQANACATASLGQTPASRLAVIDYSIASTKPRLWVFDLANNKVLFHEVVAHGQGTGENMALHFSNKDASHQSSLGLFRTADTYIGHNGYSLRMQGLEPGTNDAAMARAIVMHGAPYVNTKMAQAKGRLGRSWGCPAVRPEIAHQIIDSLKNGQMIFSYYPDSNWLAKSPFINCKSKSLMAKSGAAVADRRVAAAP